MLPVYLQVLLLILGLMTALWVVSVVLKNVSIVDMFWGFGFVLVNTYCFFVTPSTPSKVLLAVMVALWGLRLSVYLGWRNIGKPEDFRYREFRRKYGENNYWWISFFQTFLLQGILMFLIAMPLLGVNMNATSDKLSPLEYAGVLLWLTGIIFEAGGDLQLARFKKDPANKGKVLNTGLWRYTRHPNYFGDAAVWWGYGLMSIAAGAYWYALGSVLMTLLIIKVSGVALLEKSLTQQKPQYREYIRKTSAFIPWFPKK